MTDTKYRVSGMTCNGCVTSLARAITHAGVDVPFDISLEQGTLTLHAEHQPELVERAVADAGFVFEGSS